MAARSRSVGRYDLVVEVGKSQLGPLWVATEAGLEPRWVRCIALGPSAATRDVEALADIGRWSDGFRAEQAPSTLEVVSGERDLALVLGYVQSETLRSLLKLTHLKRERISTRIALALTLDVCKALAAADARAAETGRDPKFLWGGLLPDSILVGTDGTTRVLDLGVAAAWRQLSSEAWHPEVFAYSAPEQLEPGMPTPNSDVFTLGILLWEMLSGGKRLFAGTSQRAVVERLQKHRGGSATTLGDAVDAETQALLDQMLDPDPAARLRDVREIERALRGMGDAVAPPREVAEFVTAFAQHPLDSRERALKRALQRGPAELGRRPISEPPPGPTVTPTVAGRPETPAVAAAKPLPLPAQAKLGARLAIESRVPPPPPLVLINDPLPTVETRASDDDAASVRAEDILAALAVEDLEPTEIVSREVVADAIALGAAKDTADTADTADTPEPSAPTSSARRAPLTAVVVPSVVAGPDAPTLTPVPSILQTLRGPGLFESPDSELALDSAAPASPDPVTLPDVTYRAPVATAESASRAHAALAFVRGARQRLPVSLVAALGGTALLLLIALVSVGGNSAESAPEQTSKGLTEQLLVEPNAERDRPSTTEPRGQTPEAPAVLAEAPKAEAPNAIETENSNAASDTGADAAKARTATESQAAPAFAVAQVVAAPRAAAPRPARRSSAARATTSATKKKKLRATRTYIPSGI